MIMADDKDSQTEGVSSFGEVTKREEPEGEPVVTKTVETKEPETKVEGTEEVKEEVVDTTKTETENKTEEGKDSETELTDKGTKKDPNPQSALHQELANEKRTRTNYEKVLASPELLKKFLKEQYGIEVPVKAEGATGDKIATTAVEEFKTEDFESLDGVVQGMNKLSKSFGEARTADKTEIAELRTTLQGVLHDGQVTKVSNTIENDVKELRKIPELIVGNPEYIEGLENKISDEYTRLDGNGKGFYKGEHSLKEVADRFLEVVRSARKVGSQSAQTIVKDKTRGAVKTNTETDNEVDTSALSPGDAIAAGISKMKF